VNLETVEISLAGARAAAADYQRAARELPEGSEQRREFEEIARAYRLASRDGLQLIALHPTLAAGGTMQRDVVFGHGQSWERRERYVLPRLAVCRASAAYVYTRGIEDDGGLELVDSLNRRPTYRAGLVEVEAGTFEPPPAGFVGGSRLVGSYYSSAWAAMVPIVPPKHRPRRGSLLDRYLVLWEVDEWRWTSMRPPAPRDPALLQHLAGDLYAVLATWDLSELERLVLSGRRPR
jgi:hypothetical protein